MKELRAPSYRFRRNWTVLGFTAVALASACSGGEEGLGNSGGSRVGGTGGANSGGTSSGGGGTGGAAGTATAGQGGNGGKSGAAGSGATSGSGGAAGSGATAGSGGAGGGGGAADGGGGKSGSGGTGATDGGGGAGGSGATDSGGGSGGAGATDGGGGSAGTGTTTDGGGGKGGSTATDGGDSGTTGGAGGTSDAGGPTFDGGDPDTGTFASNIRLTDLAFNQGVDIPIATAGAVVDPANRLAGLVKQRQGLVQAVWATDTGFTDRTIEARLTLRYSDGSQLVLIDQRMVTAAVKADKTKLDGTFHWLLDKTQVRPDMQYSVGLFEIAGGASPATRPRIPATGTAPLGVPADEMVLEITFVPVTINNVTPVLTGQNLQDTLDGYYDWNPVHDVKMTMHAPITVTSKTIDAVLTATSKLRSSESANSKMYYIGLPSNAQTGWSGVSNITGTGKNEDRSSASPMSNTAGNFPTDKTWEFVVHETGHAQGMEHNPGCNASGTNPNWPWPNSTKTNTLGYDIKYKVMRGAQDYADYMNYCEPAWVSSFTYNNTFTRIKLLSTWPLLADPVDYSGWVLRGLVRAQGKGQWWSVPGGPVDPPGATPVRVRVSLKSGGERWVNGTEQPLDGGALKSFHAVLPAKTTELRAITVYGATETYGVPPENLSADYDDLVAGKPVLFH
jgi:hypothetical protein